MDTGVFLVMIVTGATRDRAKMLQTPIMKWMLYAFLKSGVILVIGFGKCFTMWFFNYHGFVDEYGIHWNFFMTIAITEFLINLVVELWWLSDIFVIGLFFSYEYCLWSFGLKDWVLQEERNPNNFIDANWEGILSIPLFLFIQYVANYIKIAFLAFKRK